MFDKKNIDQNTCVWLDSSGLRQHLRLFYRQIIALVRARTENWLHAAINIEGNDSCVPNFKVDSAELHWNWDVKSMISPILCPY